MELTPSKKTHIPQQGTKITPKKGEKIIPPGEDKGKPLEKRATQVGYSGKARVKGSVEEPISSTKQPTVALKQQADAELIKKDFERVIRRIQAAEPSFFLHEEITEMLEVFAQEPFKNQQAYLEKYEAKLEKIRESSELKKNFKEVILELQAKDPILSDYYIDDMIEAFGDKSIDEQKYYLRRFKERLKIVKQPKGYAAVQTLPLQKTVNPAALKGNFEQILKQIQTENPASFSDDAIKNMVELFAKEPISKQKSELERYRVLLENIWRESNLLKEEFEKVLLEIELEAFQEEIPAPSSFRPDAIKHMLAEFADAPYEEKKAYLEKYKALLEKAKKKTSPEYLKAELNKVISELKAVSPSFCSDADIKTLLETFETAKPAVQKAAIKRLKNKLNEIRPKGWIEWITTGLSYLADRTVKQYKTGKEHVEFIKELAVFLAQGTIEQAKIEIGETHVGRIASQVLDCANRSANVGGNFTRAGAALIVPFMLEWLTKLALVATGVHDPQKPEETTKEAKNVKEAVQSYLNAVTISERPINDLTHHVTNKFVADVVNTLWENSPLALLPDLDVGNLQIQLSELLMNVIQEGKKILPDYFLTLVITQLLTEIFGPMAHPLLSLDPKLIPIAARLTPVQISTITSLIVAMITIGTLPLKKSLVKFLIKGPASLKTIGVKELAKSIQKRVLGTVNPIITPIVGTVISKIVSAKIEELTKKIITGPIKTVIKTGIEVTYDEAVKKLEEELQPEAKPVPRRIRHRKWKRKSPPTSEHKK